MGYVSNTHGLSVDAPRFKYVGEPESTLSACARAYVSLGVILNRRHNSVGAIEDINCTLHSECNNKIC